jgi:predicted ATPase
VHLALGDIGESLELFKIARSNLEKTNERWFDSELHRLTTECELKAEPNRTDEAERQFRKAIEIARKQNAKTWELRAAASLAKLLKRRRRKAEAVKCLSPVYESMTEGWNSPDMKRARWVLGLLG